MILSTEIFRILRKSFDSINPLACTFYLAGGYIVGLCYLHCIKSFICRQGEEAMMSSMESLQLSDAVHLCSVTQEQVSVNQTQLVAATVSELVPIRAAYLQTFSDQQKVAMHSRYTMLMLFFYSNPTSKHFSHLPRYMYVQKK